MALILVKFTPEADFVSSKATNNHNWWKGGKNFQKIGQKFRWKRKDGSKTLSKKERKDGQKADCNVGTMEMGGKREVMEVEECCC